MGGRSSGLDLVRLALASAVIVGHSPELTDGNRHREPLTVLFNGLSLGESAVCGFFVLSGYLITASWRRNPDLWSYARNRLLRIVPAFVVAFALSVALVAPVAPLPWTLWFDVLTLGQPVVPGAWPGNSEHLVNGAMWTIRWEVFCYILAPVLAAFLNTKARLLATWLALLIVVVAAPDWAQPRFLLMFLTGAICQVARPDFSLPGIKVPDVSYGVYLYGWPVQQLLIARGIHDPMTLAIESWAVAIVLGFASWYGVERFALRLKRLHLKGDLKPLVLAGRGSLGPDEGVGVRHGASLHRLDEVEP